MFLELALCDVALGKPGSIRMEMEPFFPTIWTVFHDGCVDKVEGSIPGTVSVYVGIEYLRERFAEPGEHFIVTLPDCVKLSFQLYDGENPIVDFAAIGDECPAILSAEMEGDVCKVFMDNGILELSSADGSIRLDAGREVPLEKLLEVATIYWEEWEAKSRNGKPE